MLELTKDNFEPEVLQSEGLVLVDFWSPSCGPCKELLPKVEALAETYGDKVKFCKLDVSKARRLAIKQKVLGLPTIIMYKDGANVGEVTKDAATEDGVKNLLTSNI